MMYIASVFSQLERETIAERIRDNMHELIPGKVWVQIQESLERNKSKSFRKPRSTHSLILSLI